MCLGSNAQDNHALFNEKPVLKAVEEYAFFDNDKVPLSTNDLLANKIDKVKLQLR